MNIANTHIPEKIKDRLYPAVLDQFSKMDFHEVNIREISRLTGLSSGTIYKYFNSKEDLLFTIIDEKLMELGELMRLHVAGLESIREIFRKIFWVTMDFFDRNPELAVTAFITVPLKKFMESTAYRREKELDIIHAIVARAKKEGAVDSEIKSSYFIDLYFMISTRHIHNWYRHGMKWKLADSINDYFDFFWRMVRPLGEGHS